MTWWVHDYVQAGLYIELISWIFWVILSITLHELAHGWAAIWQGDDTPIHTGHMNANPLVHMGGHSLVIFALCGIAWGAMPVNPNRFRDGRRGDIYVSAAGPAMNLLIGAACTIILTLWLWLAPQETELYRNVAVFLFYGVGLNMILAPLNLLPIPPLDGSHILAGFSRKAAELFNRPQAMIFGMLVFMAIFFMSPVGGLLFNAAWVGAEALIDLAGSPFGNPEMFYVRWGFHLNDILDPATFEQMLQEAPAN